MNRLTYLMNLWWFRKVVISVNQKDGRLIINIPTSVKSKYWYLPLSLSLGYYPKFSLVLLLTMKFRSFAVNTWLFCQLSHIHITFLCPFIPGQKGKNLSQIQSSPILSLMLSPSLGVSKNVFVLLIVILFHSLLWLRPNITSTCWFPLGISSPLIL